MGELTPEKLAELRAVAEAAAPGPWKRCEDEAQTADGFDVIADCSCFDIDEEKSYINAEHIAAFDPPTAIKLLDELAAKDAEIATMRALIEMSAKELLPIHGRHQSMNFVMSYLGHFLATGDYDLESHNLDLPELLKCEDESGCGSVAMFEDGSAKVCAEHAMGDTPIELVGI